MSYSQDRIRTKNEDHMQLRFGRMQVTSYIWPSLIMQINVSF